MDQETGPRDRHPDTPGQDDMAQTDPQLPDPKDGAPTKQHGDPLLEAAQGRGSGDDGSRHGHDATAASRKTRQEPDDDEAGS